MLIGVMSLIFNQSQTLLRPGGDFENSCSPGGDFTLTGRDFGNSHGPIGILRRFQPCTNFIAFLNVEDEVSLNAEDIALFHVEDIALVTYDTVNTYVSAQC